MPLESIDTIQKLWSEFANECVRVCGNWLFACDRDDRGYRLPLPNLHDDCLISVDYSPVDRPGWRRSPLLSSTQYAASSSAPRTGSAPVK